MSNLIPFGQSAQQTTNKKQLNTLFVHLYFPQNGKPWFAYFVKQDETGNEVVFEHFIKNHKTAKMLNRVIADLVLEEKAISFLEFDDYGDCFLKVTIGPKEPDKVAYKIVSPSGNNGGLLPWQQWADFPYPIISGVA